jgi:DNA-directed RNA polymerase subunit L
MVSKCQKFLYDLENGNVPIIQSETTLKNGFDITLIGEDYTLGKVIEFYLYQEHFIADKTLSFCGFRKPHPHSTDSMIRVAFHNQVDKVGVSGYFQGACDSAITAFTKIIEQLGGELSKLSKSSAPVAASAAAVASSVSKSSLKSNLKESKGASASSKGEGSAGASTSSKQKLSTKKSDE